MKKRMTVLLAAALMVMGISAGAAETESVTEAAQETEVAAETEERNYEPEQGTGWLSVKINGTPVEFEYESALKGMTGTTYSFEAEEYTLSITFDKKLEIGKEMGANSITQIEVMSSENSSSGYYFAKKSAGTDVDSTVTLAEAASEEIMQGEFTVKVPTADRYVGDNRPGILPELDLTDGEFCFQE